jgi:hypothetical protein
MGKKLDRHAHDDRDYRSGRYRKSPACDGCGKPCGTNYFTDDEVCGSGDGPGFFLCDRARCCKKRDLDVEGRRALYTAQRAINDGADRPAPVAENAERDAAKRAEFEAKRAVVRPKRAVAKKHSCEVERTFKVTHGKINMGTGAYTQGRSEIVTEPCNVPLFDTEGEDCDLGVCSSCRRQWTHPDNYPTDKGKALIAASLAAKPLPSKEKGA